MFKSRLCIPLAGLLITGLATMAAVNQRPAPALGTAEYMQPLGAALDGLHEFPPMPEAVVTARATAQALRDVQLDVPFYPQMERGHGFRAGARACYRAAVAMARDARGVYGMGEGATVLGPQARFQIGLAEDGSGQLVQIDEDTASEAVEYIDAQLARGRPVVVGGSHKNANYNVDGLTDHFVVIDGRQVVDGQVRYTLLDPATRKAERARGEFILEPDGRLVREGPVARGSVALRRLEVTMVRRNRR